ncbi:MAG TPA: four-carbon acid sugar kinase family protein [Acidimicrobiales bacterium]|nr:four-carbon acid sugar kinase family protein [Acidimicrobiales bacterium]
MTRVTRPLACFYGDDFTGSTDAMANFVRWGLSVRLFFDAGLAARATDVDVVGIAGTARSLQAEAMAGELRPVFKTFDSLRPAVVQYKVCSTFDSSPQVGSIGKACEVATEVWGPRPIPVLVAQPELGRWTFCGHHFARAGDGQIWRLDRHPGMAEHPVTPALDSDLVAVLQRQTQRLPVISVCRHDLANYPNKARAHRGPIVLDAIDEADLRYIGRLLWSSRQGPPLVAVGSGGLSYALGSVLGPGLKLPRPPSPVGQVLAVSGSYAPETARQVQEAVAAGWEPVDVAALGLEASIGTALRALRSGRSVVAYSALGTRPMGDGAASGVPGAPGSPSGALGQMAAAVLKEHPVHRLVVAGGDTAGQVMRAIGGDGLDYLTTIAGTSALCTLRAGLCSGKPIEVVLKGGQIGGPDFFEQVRLARSSHNGAGHP